MQKYIFVGATVLQKEDLCHNDMLKLSKYAILTHKIQLVQIMIWGILKNKIKKQGGKYEFRKIYNQGTADGSGGR